jgi:hypothetical protein
MDTKDTISMPKNAELFHCNICDFKCSKKSNHAKHMLTSKHLKRYKMIQNDTSNNAKNATAYYVCDCGKEFVYHSGLWRHKQKCIHDNNITDMDDKSLIIKLLQQNQELQKSLIELSKEKSINNNINSHNKTFNLQFFLNETCKDALNITDFVSSIKLQLSDLENTGRLGYVEGISNIILNNLKTLDTRERPIHCSDSKREIIYIKNDNQWTKENEDNPVLTNAIKVIANENIKQISQWKKNNPDCTDSESKKNNLYLKIVSNAMSGSSKYETDKNINKIISNVAKEIIINKD